MKEVLDLFKESTDPEFIQGQLLKVHDNKNVFFINPQLNGRHFYKYLLPYIAMYEFHQWGTAVSSVDKYKPNKEYEQSKIPLNSPQILWADYIVFPFTTQFLPEIYQRLKSINPQVNIVYHVDFNYYKLSKKHVLYEKFHSEQAISDIEDNIFYSDLTIVTNPKLSEILLDKFSNELTKEKYKGIRTNLEICCQPLFIDMPVIMENIELDIPELPEEEIAPLRIGIIATNYTWEDIDSYKKLLKEAQDKLGDKVKFIVMGFDGIDHVTEKSCFPEGFEFQHIPPCTVIHYFKQLRNLQLDMLFIPLRQNEYNISSENYNKYLEASLFEIPVMVYDIHPYNELIKNGHTGILLQKKKEFIERLEHFEKNREDLKRIGKNAHQLVMDNFTYNEQNILILDKIYSKNENE